MLLVGLILNPYLVVSASESAAMFKDTKITDTESIEKIAVLGRDSTKKLLSSGFKVDLLLTEEFKNSNYNLTQILQRSPGITVRQNGGLGSEFNLALNGLSGNQIRYFFDGIPMEDFGSALNFPANLVEKIEIYKGVVPITLGADALGGAINIITPELNQELVDLSYTYGSFNTHKATAFVQTDLNNDYFLRVSANAEHSDNNYWMNNVSEIDKFGNVLGTMRVKRFNDQYSAAMVNIKSGVTNTWYADELSLSVTHAANRNNEQHPTTSINEVFGKYHTDNQTTLLSTLYKKSFSDFSVNAYLLSGSVNETTNDSYSRDYDWHGQFKEKQDKAQGELASRSKFTLKDNVFRASLSGQYHLSDNSNISLNYSANYLKRKGKDNLNANNVAFSLPNWIRKSVIGLAFDSKALNQALNINIFAKHYIFTGEINAEESINFNLQNIKTHIDFNNTGYGTALSYQVNPQFLLKASYENTYRLPQAQEILGTGQYVRPNAHLNPEQSHNMNLGAKFEFSSENTFSLFETNVFYRDSSDFIYYVPDRVVYGQYKNLQKVETTGIESSYYLTFYDNYSVQFNATYQDLLNKSRLDTDGDRDFNYNNRMPNEPYLFANIRLSASFDIANDQLTLFWTTAFIEKFFLNWEGSGNQDDKLYIPKQLTHDIDIQYMFADGDYNLSLSARNIFDAEIYDNFNIEKPGRAFYLKFRYVY